MNRVIPVIFKIHLDTRGRARKLSNYMLLRKLYFNSRITEL